MTRCPSGRDSAIATERTRLVPWRPDHRPPFDALHADAYAMRFLGGPLTPHDCKAKMRRYFEAGRDHGVCRWAVEDLVGNLLGYCGVMPQFDLEHPLGTHYDIGWSFFPRVWGRGFATESAKAAITHAAHILDGTPIFAYTDPTNERSIAVMDRLRLTRHREFDFVHRYPSGDWHGLVWSTGPRTRQ